MQKAALMQGQKPFTEHFTALKTEKPQTQKL